MKRIWVNEDNAHFYDCHPPQDMSVAGLQKLVDAWLTPPSNVAGMLFCTNVQRALFDSRAWEPLYHDYDPQRPIEQQPQFAFLPPRGQDLTPNVRGRYWVHQLWLLKQRGVNHLQVWIDRCRFHGAQGWLSMRMNDCHHNPQAQAFWHSTLWKMRPDLHRARYRDEGWFETAFDYGKPEVVEHHLSLLRELCERFDLDGLELDWNRWVLHFAPGHEKQGASILTRVVAEARLHTQGAARRLGHPVALGVRLPSDAQACLDLGYDIIEWARGGLVDQVTLAPFFEQAMFDWPVELWRGIFGDKVRLLCQPECVMRAFPQAGPQGHILDYGLLYGGASAALECGTDGVYLFNECYRENEPAGGLSSRFPGVLDHLRRDVGDSDALARLPRRYPLSYAQVVGPGRPSGSVLPIALTRAKGHWEFGRYGNFIPLRLPFGAAPGAGQRVRLELGFDAQTPPLAPEAIAAWFNAARLEAPAAPLEGLILPGPEVVAQRLAFEVPAAMVRPGVNVAELVVPELSGKLTWAELVALGQ
jgi:hypothetical protein